MTGEGKVTEYVDRIVMTAWYAQTALDARILDDAHVVPGMASTGQTRTHAMHDVQLRLMENVRLT